MRTVAPYPQNYLGRALVMPTIRVVALFLGALGGGAEVARAQVPDPSAPPVLADGRPLPGAQEVIARNERGVTVRATRIDTPLRIDGKLDEAAYQQVPAITQFIQQEPRDGAPVSESTSAWVLFDDDNLYVSCRC